MMNRQKEESIAMHLQYTRDNVWGDLDGGGEAERVVVFGRRQRIS